LGAGGPDHGRTAADNGAGATRKAAVRRRGADGRDGRRRGEGRPEQTLVGDEDRDMVVLVEYPSRKAFIEMVTSPAYADAHEHREAGLERTVLIACRQA
jgi:uncharacterized protein (DUF1330 family)